MNTSNLKKVAPKARIAFINAITARAAEFGITAQGCAEPVISGEVLQVGNFTHPAKWAPSLQRLQQKVAELGFAQLMEQMYLFTRTGLTASVLPGWDNLSSRCTP